MIGQNDLVPVNCNLQVKRENSLGFKKIVFDLDVTLLSKGGFLQSWIRHCMTGNVPEMDATLSKAVVWL
jgi:hypothetical protein